MPIRTSTHTDIEKFIFLINYVLANLNIYSGKGDRMLYEVCCSSNNKIICYSS
jgi:hypothetical protein